MCARRCVSQNISGLTPDTYGGAPAAVVGFGAPGGLRGPKMLSVQRMQFSVM